MDGKPTLASPELLLAHVEWVRRLARALVRSDDADDVVQQTYAQALVAPRPARNLRGWLGAIARNVVRRGARDAATRAHHETRAPTPAHAPDPVESVARAELHRRVVEAVLALDEPYRSTLVMRFFDDQPADAIARAVGVPMETVRTRVKQGIARLRARLERAVGGDDAAGLVARALWFERLRAFAGDGAKGAVAGGAGAAAGAIAWTARAAWIASGLAAAIVVGTAMWWVPARSAKRVESTAMSQTRGAAPIAPPLSATRNDTSPPAPPTAATRTSEPKPSAPPAATPPAMKPLIGGPRGVVRGRVVDARDEPVAGAEVRALMGEGFSDLNRYAVSRWQKTTSRQPDPRPLGSTETRSDAEGRFEIHSLSTIHHWSLGAFEPSHGAAFIPSLQFDAEHSSQEVELKLIAGAFVHVSVRDEQGRPIAGATVNFGIAQGRESNRVSSWTTYYTTDDGTWSAGFCCGEVAARVEAPGFVGAPLQWTTLEIGRTDVDLAIVLHSKNELLVEGPIVVVDAATGATRDAGDLEVLLERALGPLEEERANHPPPGFGRIAVGAAAAGNARPVVGAYVDPGWAVGRVDVARGRYEVHLPADFHGTLFLAVHGTVVGVAALDDVARPPPLPLEARRIPPRRATTRLVVRVVDAITREPVDLAAGWVSVVAPRPYGTQFNLDPISSRDTTTGTAEFVASPGRIKIRADIAGYASTAKEIVVAPDERRHEITLALDRATAGLRGRALRVDGSPIRMMYVRLYRVLPDGVVETTGLDRGTNSDGEFEVLGLAAADHVVVVESEDGQERAIGRARAADPPTELELRAESGTRTEIHLKVPAPPAAGNFINQMFRIVDEEGVPLVDMFAGWFSSSGGTDTLAPTLLPGSYRVFVWRNGFSEATRAFDVPSEDPIELELEPAR